jgi:hypothetical protein
MPRPRVVHTPPPGLLTRQEAWAVVLPRLGELTDAQAAAEMARLTDRPLSVARIGARRRAQGIVGAQALEAAARAEADREAAALLPPREGEDGPVYRARAERLGRALLRLAAA